MTELIDYAGFCGLPPSRGEGVERQPLPVSAFEVHRRQARGENFLLLDVRDPEEFERARIEGSRLIPVDALADRLDEISDFRRMSVVVHCHHGPRSRRAARLLIDQGFESVEELTGGIEAWSVTVDPSVQRY